MPVIVAADVQNEADLSAAIFQPSDDFANGDAAASRTINADNNTTLTKSLPRIAGKIIQSTRNPTARTSAIGETVMRVRQHNSDFVAGTDPTEAEFTNLVELLSIGFVARARKHKDFYHFAVSEYGNPREHALCPHGWQLIGLYDGGKKWWVVGYLDKLSPDLQVRVDSIIMC
jgi:hypothetical protein